MSDKEYLNLAKKKIGESMAYAIKERGFTKDKLSLESGVSKTIIYKVLKGENYEINALIRIMRVLQIHLDISLMDWNNNVIANNGEKPSLN